MIAPCYGCKDREIGCHGKCGPYQAYQAENELKKKKKREDYPVWIDWKKRNREAVESARRARLWNERSK